MQKNVVKFHDARGKTCDKNQTSDSKNKEDNIITNSQHLISLIKGNKVF